MLLDGYVKDKGGMPIAKASIEIKGDDFVTRYRTESDAEGYYQLDVPANVYPFLTAVKEYAVNYLEYWCQNIPLYQNMSLDICFDTIEIYGLHVFSVIGAGNGLMAYFRPMSLAKFRQGVQNIEPDDMTVKAVVDGRERSVIAVNKVKELVADREMAAYLIQVETESGWGRFDVQITDKDGSYGAATIFNDRR